MQGCRGLVGWSRAAARPCLALGSGFKWSLVTGDSRHVMSKIDCSLPRHFTVEGFDLQHIAAILKPCSSFCISFFFCLCNWLHHYTIVVNKSETLYPELYLKTIKCSILSKNTVCHTYNQYSPGPWNPRPRRSWSQDQRHFGRIKEQGAWNWAQKMKFTYFFRFFLSVRPERWIVTIPLLDQWLARAA